MLANRRNRSKKADADLDITSFMNLMIVLVPVLLMMMVFSRITVVELTLPGLAGISDPQEIEAQKLEVEVDDSGLQVFFPQGYLVTSIPMIEPQEETNDATITTPINTASQAMLVHDFTALQNTLKQYR